MAKCEFHDDFRDILLREIAERKSEDDKLAKGLDKLQYWIMGSLGATIITLITVLFKGGK